MFNCDVNFQEIGGNFYAPVFTIKNRGETNLVDRRWQNFRLLLAAFIPTAPLLIFFRL